MTSEDSAKWDAFLEGWQKSSEAFINAARESAEAFRTFIESVTKEENKNG